MWEVRADSISIGVAAAYTENDDKTYRLERIRQFNSLWQHLQFAMKIRHVARLLPDFTCLLSSISL
jgi:hypothetical protein